MSRHSHHLGLTPHVLHIRHKEKDAWREETSVSNDGLCTVPGVYKRGAIAVHQPLFLPKFRKLKLNGLKVI